MSDTFTEHLRNQLPFDFHTPATAIRTIRNIIYGRREDGVEGMDKEDAVHAVCRIVSGSMERSFRMGLTYGIEYGQTINRTVE